MKEDEVKAYVKKRYGEIAQNTSSCGPSCGCNCESASKDQSLQIGYSNDELDKIPGEDIEYCYELLSNGKCSVHSAKIHEEIKSNFIMIAFANPSSQIFGKHPIDEISLPPLLMSRFALIVKTEKIDKDTRLNLFMQKFYGKGEIKEKSSFYAQWVEMAKEHNPAITADKKRIKKYLSTINEIVEETYATQLRRDLRMGDYIRRVPQAIARAGYDSISNEVLDAAENIFVESISTWHQNR